MQSLFRIWRLWLAPGEIPVEAQFTEFNRGRAGRAWLQTAGPGELTAPWTALLAPARAACTAAIAAAAAAVAAAVAAIASEADHQPPAAPSVAATGAAVTVDVGAMSKADQRALLAKLTLAMNH